MVDQFYQLSSDEGSCAILSIINHVKSTINKFLLEIADEDINDNESDIGNNDSDSQRTVRDYSSLS